ncbi:unnamed protein product [Protopolystoma xenopodis]|uniref:Uncharacterized protein n=1 Tax=Protopolystoma xenopodis TaxID=117903 RepID=A0A3S5C3R0_9PLAT|nr:unnamed protein product [Protopolystoma xenopodis]
MEMVNRGRISGFISSALVAAFSGVSVAFAILSNSVAAMIGNAISLSLLPPAVNCVSISMVVDTQFYLSS